MKYRVPSMTIGMVITGAVALTGAGSLLETAGTPASAAAVSATANGANDAKDTLRDDPSYLEKRIQRSALHEVGVSEPHQCDKYWWYGHRPAPCGDDSSGAWCAAFAGWVWHSVGAPQIPKSYYVPEWVSWAKDKGLWSHTPHVGDAVIYGDGDHMGIVVAVHGKHDIDTVEGNTGPGPNNKVMHKTHVNTSARGVEGYVRPRTK